MAILDRYILKEVSGIFLFGLTLFTMLLAINHLFFLARFALQAQVPLPVVTRLLLLSVPKLMSLALPMALLLGALLTVSRLSDRNEVIAMRTSGISLGRVALPVLAAGLLVSAAGVVLGEWIAPIADDRYREEFRLASGQPQVKRGYVLFREQQGSQVSVVYARGFGDAEDTLEEVTLTQSDAGRVVHVIQAARAHHASGEWEFQDGTLYLLTGPATVETRFARMKVGIARTPREILLQQKDPSEMTIKELRAYIGVLRASGESVVQYLVWLHSRLAIPASSAIFALIAVPLGLRPHRSGRSIGLGLTLLIVIVYYVLISTTLALGQTGRLPALLAAWSPNLIVGSVGGYLLWRAR